MKKILGLDLGTNSIGWALVDEDDNGKPYKIAGMGSRIIPMGTDKQDYEKGVGITKNAERREKRTSRKINKRYKLRRNKLLFILDELGMLPEQFQFKNGIPEPNKIQDLELLPIKRNRKYDISGKRLDRFYVDGKRILQEPNSILNYKLRDRALFDVVKLNEIGKILYQFNQLRGYAGGNNDDAKTKKDNKNGDDEIIKYEVITQKVEIQNVKKSDKTFKVRGGINKGQELNKYDVVILFDCTELEGETELQNLQEKIGQEEDLEIRIKRNKKGEPTSIVFALPQKTNWRKQMEKTEEDLKQGNLYISQLILQDLEQNKWTKIRNRVFLRNRYEAEFDAIWNNQYKNNPEFKQIVDDQQKRERIINYIFPERDKTKPETKESRESKKEEYKALARERGLKYIIKEQVIYYQRPLKPQTELISHCQFEKNEKVLANSHPLFQEFRCWDQINRIYITSKQEVYNERKKKNVFQYSDRFLSNNEKHEIYNRLQTQKQLSFNEVAKIINLKNDKTEYLNGLNVKAKLKGCDTLKTIKDKLGEYFNPLVEKDNYVVEKLWQAIFDNANNGNEYDPKSLRVSSIKEVLKPLNDGNLITELALKLTQGIKFPRKYGSLSEKAINNILPLMQLNPTNVSDAIKHKFQLIQTGEIIDDIQIEKLEDYVVSFIENTPDALHKGGLMFAFASSLFYGKHTKETIKPQIKNYHDIKYDKDIEEKRKKEIRNPIVMQIANETMQVIKAIWKEYKFNPDELEIRVELARDLKNSAAERDKIYKGQIKNQKINGAVKERLRENKMSITDENILKYKLYEQQKFRSPYSGDTMEVSLFNSYEIDHIVPKSRYFDDSFTNKVLVEGFLNEEKSNRTAWEYISQQCSKFKIQNVDSYINHVNENFFGRKKKNLLLEKIPTNPVERQIKDTQYISIAVKNELAKIVGSDNIKTSTGEVTDFLRSRWGLKKLFMELTEDRFKQMELWDWNRETNQSNSNWVQKYYNKKKEKQIYEIKNWSKRYDHRHHAIDALVVALTTQSHIQRLNNLNKYLQEELSKRKEEFKIETKEGENIIEAFFNLEQKRRKEIQEQIESSRYFEKPLDDLVKQTKTLLETMVVSIKPKDKLIIKTDDKGKKQLKIRGALHQETKYGKTKDSKTGLLRDTKTIELSKLAAKDISQIVDQDVLAKEIDTHKKKYDSMKEAFTGEGLKTFNESRFRKNNPTKLKPPVYKVKVWYSNKEDDESTLQRLYSSNEKLSVVTGDNYLFVVMEKETSKGKERIFDIVTLFDSVDIAKRALREKDEDFKKRVIDEKIIATKNRLIDESIYKQEDLKVKILNATGKKKAKLQTELNELFVEDIKVNYLFTLQQNELVYLPEPNDDPVSQFDNEVFQCWIQDKDNKKRFSKRVYRTVKLDSNQKTAHFLPNNYANTISIPKDLTEEQKKELKRKYPDKKIPKKELNFVEFGSYRDCSPYESGDIFIKSLVNKKETKKPLRIQDSGIKIRIDWLGNISK